MFCSLLQLRCIRTRFVASVRFPVYTGSVPRLLLLLIVSGNSVVVPPHVPCPNQVMSRSRALANGVSLLLCTSGEAFASSVARPGRRRSCVISLSCGVDVAAVLGGPKQHVIRDGSAHPRLERTRSCRQKSRSVGANTKLRPGLPRMAL